MKKTALLVLTLFLFTCLPVFADLLADKKAELQKVKAYINVLDVKIKKARRARQKQKLAVLQKDKTKQLQRGKKLRLEITKLEAEARKPVAKLPVVPVVEEVPVKEVIKVRPANGYWRATAGNGAGAVVLGLGYVWPAGYFPQINLDFQYGLGNRYSVAIGKIAGQFQGGQYFMGIGGTLANYSEAVADIPGISGTLDKGLHFGAAVYFGTYLWQVPLQVGYDSALGVNAGIAFKL